MSLTSGSFQILDYKTDCFRISLSGALTGADVQQLRQEVAQSIENGYGVVYVDAKGVSETDLSGINEVINAHYTLDKAGKKLVFLYQKGSPVETWVETTGLDKFVATARVPAA